MYRNQVVCQLKLAKFYDYSNPMSFWLFLLLVVFRSFTVS